jgi:chorismate mutase/prephenate dehydratase
MAVAFFGPEATFTHMAAQRHFGSTVRYRAEPTIDDVFREVGAGNVTYGVVPIENSTEGVVTHTLDLLQDANVQICGEVSVDIELCLLSRSGRPRDVKRILSHSHALGQCRRWIGAHYAGATVEEVSSTAQAAKEARSDREAAAVSSRLAGDVYGLRIVHANIADNHDNITRFFVIGDNPPSATGEDKTSIVFAAKDRVGVLHEMLTPFAEHDITLTKIESRPSRQKAWEYVFFIDFRGHRQEPKVRSALEQLAKNCVFLKELGSYPCSI